jgi:hypothetical protein
MDKEKNGGYMVGLRFLYRFIGVLWLIFGGLILLLVAAYLIAFKLTDNYMLQVIPPALDSAIAPLLRHVSPGIQQAAGIGFGLFCTAIGMGLVTLRGWARTIGVACHFIMGLAILVIMFVLYHSMTTLSNLGILFPASWFKSLFITFFLISMGLLALSFQLSTHSAIETFSGHVPTPPPMPPVNCPTCGGFLDLEKARCPKCDTELEQPNIPNRARLANLEKDQEFSVSTRRQTLVGRGDPNLEIPLEDPAVSADHAMIEFVAGHFYLHARKDTNGTYVNGMNNRIRDIEIKNNDEVIFGRSRFRFIVE